jgi:hypothetical protein
MVCFSHHNQKEYILKWGNGGHVGEENEEGKLSKPYPVQEPSLLLLV